MAKRQRKNPKSKVNAKRGPNAPVATAIRMRATPGTGVVRLPGSSTLISIDQKFTNGQIICSDIIQPSSVRTLQAQADVFQKYRFTQLSATVITDSPTSAQGMIAIAFIRDPADALPNDEINIVDVIDAQEGAKRSKIWEQVTVHAKPTPWLYTSPSAEIRESAAYRLAIVHLGTGTIMTKLQVKLEYQVEFKDRTLSQEDGINPTPTIREGIVLAFRSGHTGIWVQKEVAGQITWVGPNAPQGIDFPFPVLTGEEEKHSLHFFWRTPSAITDVGPTEVWNYRKIHVTNEDTNWVMYPADLTRTTDYKEQQHDTVWLDEFDLLVPDITYHPNPVGATNLALPSTSTARSGQPSKGWMPTLEAVLSHSSLLKAYCRSGLLISKRD